ncbi:MAG: hypothetical protein CTY25_09280 [Methylobacterium sp.]|nr:MAG: hypothetical protein CTY25_09280 [Methylobacterium sp.]
MWRFKRPNLTRQARRSGDVNPARTYEAARLFRRFFALIERLERPAAALETKSEPARKLRITRLDEDASRRP